MRVQPHAEPTRELRRLAHQPPSHREGRTRRDRDLDEAVVVLQSGEALGLGEHVVDLLDECVGRQAAVGLAEVHRSARRDDANAELA
jgi:hypothetical protein